MFSNEVVTLFFGLVILVAGLALGFAGPISILLEDRRAQQDAALIAGSPFNTMTADGKPFRTSSNNPKLYFIKLATTILGGIAATIGAGITVYGLYLMYWPIQ